MKTLRRCIILLLVLFYAGAVFAGGTQETEQPEKQIEETQQEGSSSANLSDRILEDSETSITIIDDLGNTVEIAKPIETIIILDGKSAHIIRGLNAEKMVIAHSSAMKLYERLFPHITATPDIGKGEMDYEKIIELNPDLIIQSYINMGEKAEPLAPYFPVVRMAFENTEDITILGAILDKEAEAETYVDWIESYTNNIDECVAELNESDIPDIFIYYGGHYGMSTPPPFGSYGKKNVVGNRLVTRAGGRSITADIPGDYIDVESEWVIEQDPEIIIREYYFNSLSKDPVFGFDAVQGPLAAEMMDTLISLPAMGTSTAAKNKDIHFIYGYFVQEYWFLGLSYLAEWFHPELFPDMTAEKMIQEFVTDILRIDNFDVSKEGLYSMSLE